MKNKIFREWFTKILFLLIFTISLIVLYIQTSHVFSYMGFEYNLSSYTRLFYLTIILILVLTLYYSKIDNVTKLIFNLIVIINYIPLYVLILLNNKFSVIPFIYLSISLLIYHVLNKYINELNFRRVKLKIYSYYTVLFGLIILCFSIVIYGYGFNLDVASIFDIDIYEVRDEYKQSSQRFTVYAFNGLGRVLLPIVFILGVIRNNIAFIIIAVLGQILLFGIGGHKVTILILPVIYIFYRILNKNVILNAVTIPLALTIFSSSIAIVNYLSGTFTVISSMLIRRMFFVPALMHQYYFDFFSNNPKDLFAQHFPFSIILESNYQMDIPYLIGGDYLNNYSVHANANVFANGYANIGIISIIIIPFILVVFFKLFNQSFDAKDNRILFPLLISPVIYLANTGIITVMVTHGLLFLLILVLLMPKNLRHK